MKTPTANYRNMLKNDIVTMLQCDVIVMLEDWECSEYCKKLRRFAIECGIMLVSEDAI